MHPSIPNAVIVIGTGGRRSFTLYGHFAAGTWKLGEEELHEVLLVAENITRPAKDVFTTLLHEAVHGIAHARKIKDCSGRRHNRKFALLCDEVGLEAPEVPNPTLGFSAATLPDGMYEDQIAKIDEALKIHRMFKLDTKETKKSTWIAECDCGRKIRMGKKTLEDAHGEETRIKCMLCDSEFMAEDDELPNV